LSELNDLAKSSAGGIDVSQISLPGFDLSSLGIRIQQYVGGVIMALDHPLFGIGGSNYPYVAPAYGLPGKVVSGLPFPLHNTYIAILAETGVPGFLCYILTFGLVLLTGWRLFVERTAQRVFLSGIVAAIIGYAAVSFWYPNNKFVFVLPFWLLMGAMVATTTTSERTITAN
jgi:O-antigen ligase